MNTRLQRLGEGSELTGKAKERKPCGIINNSKEMERWLGLECAECGRSLGGAAQSLTAWYPSGELCPPMVRAQKGEAGWGGTEFGPSRPALPAVLLSHWAILLSVKGPPPQVDQ